MKNIFLGMICCLLLFCSCTATSTAYHVKGELKDSTFDGRTIYIVQRDNRVKIDSTRIEGNRFSFNGKIDTAVCCEVSVSKNAYAFFILENGNITLDLYGHIFPQGSPMNEQISYINRTTDSLQNIFTIKLDSLIDAYFRGKGIEPPQNRNGEIPSEVLYEQLPAIAAQKNFVEDSICREILSRHNNDALGQYLIMYSYIYSSDVDKQIDILNHIGPWLKSRKNIQKKIKTVKALKNTAVGQPYIDIKGRDINGNDIALSDFFGRGNYVLMDMWASWCIPCKQEIPNLAYLHDKYKDKGLTVVGIFVWDKEKNMKRAVEKEKISWPQIFDVQNNVRKNYGVEGIPHIILFAPDGTILARNLRGKSMITDVEYILQNKR